MKISFRVAITSTEVVTPYYEMMQALFAELTTAKEPWVHVDNPDGEQEFVVFTGITSAENAPEYLNTLEIIRLDPSAIFVPAILDQLDFGQSLIDVQGEGVTPLAKHLMFASNVHANARIHNEMRIEAVEEALQMALDELAICQERIASYMSYQRDENHINHHLPEIVGELAVAVGEEDIIKNYAQTHTLQ